MAVPLCGCTAPIAKPLFPSLMATPSPAKSQPESTFQSDVHVLAAQRDAEAPSTRNEKKQFSPGLTYLSTNFDIMRVRVPAGMATESETIWNLVDEQVLAAQTIQLLRKNGFRVGLATEADWAAIKVTFDEADQVSVNRLQFSPKNAGPLRIELDEGPNRNTIFFYRSDGTLAGSAWPESRKLINLRYQVDPEDLARVFLRIEPEIRQQKVGLRWKKTSVGMRQVPIFSGQVYSELAVSLPVPPQSVLVIGPSPAARHRTLIGQAFLTDTDDQGRTSEVILFFAPTVVRTTTARLR